MESMKAKLIRESESNQIALIFSVSELHEYYIETINQGEISIIKENQDLKMFQSFSDAKRAAKKLGCERMYMCLDNTYDECGGLSEQDRFTYMPIT